MTDRDKLSGYPCPTHMHHHDVCDGDCTWRVMCDLKPIYDAHIKLRDDMRKLRAAVLGEMTPAVAREIYSATAGLCEGMALYNAAGRLHALADVVAKL